MRGLTRIAHEIVERNKGGENIVLIGIKTRGYPLAKRLQEKINQIEELLIPISEIDITYYRDDLDEKKENLNAPTIDIDITNKKVILVDDVLYTERNKGGENIVLIGIKTRGYPLAKRLQEKINQIEELLIPISEIDITYYRDDLDEKKENLNAPTIDIDITNKKVILVDDVLYTG